MEQSSLEQPSAAESPYAELYANAQPDGQEDADSVAQYSSDYSDSSQSPSLYGETDEQQPSNDDYSAMEEEDLAFSEPEDSAPVDTASILAKFGHSLDQDEEDVTGTIALDTLASSSFDEPSAVDELSSGEDESIDDYMTQLMARVGGGDYQTQSPNAATADDEGSKTILLNSDEPKQQQTAGKEAPKHAAPLDPSEFVPRAVAPEASSNLRALRAVANTSARSAIDRHQRRSFDNKAYISWFIAIVAAIVCFSMAFFAKSLFSLPTLVSMVSLLISFFATINALAFSAKAKIGARSTQKKLAANIEEASVPRLPAK